MSNHIAERLIRLRKALKLNQGQFSEPLGLSSATISSIELGKSQLTEQTIRLICLTFNINETWLRAGTGPMFNGYSPYEQQLLKKFRRIPPDRQEHILHYMDLLLTGSPQSSSEPEEPSP